MQKGSGIVCTLIIFFFGSVYDLNAQNKSYYNHKHFGTYYEEFNYQKDLMDFIDVKPGDVIADVGADDAHFTLALTLLYDNITLYAEDIDPKRLNRKKFNKQVAYYTKLKGKPLDDNLQYTIGTYTSTNLPENTF